jgi:hypothetical protein
MTPEERAEKIYESLTMDDDRSPTNEARALHITQIAAQIREAVEEAIVTQTETIQPAVVRQAKAEAYEDAAKIAEADESGCFECGEPGKVIAEAIRARAKEIQ